MRRFLPLITSLLVSIGHLPGLAAQDIRSVTQTIVLGKEADRLEPFVRLLLPLQDSRTTVAGFDASIPPSGVDKQNGEVTLAWDEASLRDRDSLIITYRLLSRSIPAWPLGDRSLLDSVVAGSTDYPLPTLSRDDFARTRYAGLREERRGKMVDEIVTTLFRRILITDDPEAFDLTQPLLQDMHRRLTTERRYPLLVSLTLQYYNIAHRLVTGKIIADGEIFENQLWIDVRVGEGWRRLPTSVNPDYLAYSESFQFLPCSYDYRRFTFELFGMPTAEWRMTAQSLLLDFWDKKNEALVAKQYPRALAMLDSMLVYAPTMLTVISERGLVLTEAGHPTEGLRYLQYAMKEASKPTDKSQSMLQMARYYALTDDFPQAVRAVREANLIVPLDPDLVYTDLRFRKLLADRASARKINALFNAY